MNLRMPGKLADNYKNPAQRARVVTESWGEENLYCANCASPKLNRSVHGMQVVDYVCPECQSPFQLKSQSKAFSERIVDAGYEAMRRAIVEGRTPNLLALHYDLARWQVRNLFLVPRFAFPLSCLEKRKPLSPLARRKGWVGCNILLTSIPLDARIQILVEGVPVPASKVREQYARLRPLGKLNQKARGWTLDVLNVVRGIGRREFTLAEVYAHEAALARLHPGNLHVRDKIRQQLQVLRDLGLVEFLGGGSYRT
ncbi:MAG TPA: DpnI domain-containing protein [Terriglobia bacterium]|nr:DpnI domain-containing protein [Terriglobia bacterium]